MGLGCLVGAYLARGSCLRMTLAVSYVTRVGAVMVPESIVCVTH